MSYQRGLDTAGDIVASGKLVFSESGGDTPLAVYTDPGLSTGSGTTVTADSNGLFSAIWGQFRAYRVKFMSNDLGTTYWTLDPWIPSRTRLYEAALPSTNFRGEEVVVDNILYERNEADTAWQSRGNVDTQNTKSEPVNENTGTSYTVDAEEDRGTLLTHSNLSAIAVTQPAADPTDFPDGWFQTHRNLNTGPVTITPSSGTIGGRAALVLGYGDQGRPVSDGTNYQVKDLIRSRNVVKLNEAATISLAHEMKRLLHDETTARVWTIAAANFPTTAPFTFECDIFNRGGTLTMSITGGTLARADGIPGTGTRTIASSSVCTLSQLSSTVFVLSGAFT